MRAAEDLRRSWASVPTVVVEDAFGVGEDALGVGEGGVGSTWEDKEAEEVAVEDVRAVVVDVRVGELGGGETG